MNDASEGIELDGRGRPGKAAARRARGAAPFARHSVKVNAGAVEDDDDGAAEDIGLVMVWCGDCDGTRGKERVQHNEQHFNFFSIDDAKACCSSERRLRLPLALAGPMAPRVVASCDISLLESAKRTGPI